MAVNIGTAVAYLDLNMTAFNAGLQQAQSALQTFQNSSSTMGQNLMAVGGLATNVGSSLTRNITMPLIGAGQEVVEFGATFDKQMSAVEAVMKDKIKDGDIERLREAAMYWGEQTVYTATEAGEALYYMGLAGWDVEQAINGLGSVLNLAAAGQLDLGRAADVVTDSMTAMNLVAGQATNGIENTAYYTSVLAAVMANSNTDIDQMGEAFKYIAPIAGNLDYTIEDLGLALGLAANAGIKSSQAGTSLRQALKQLISPTEKTANAMEKYGITLFDAQGQALPFRQVMLQLQETFGDLNVEVFDANGELREGEELMQEYGDSLPISQQEKLAAIVDLFGTRAMPTMLAIIQQGGTEFDKLASHIDEAARTGEYAAEMAYTQMDNLHGAWVRFTSALGTTKIMLNDLVSNELKSFIETLTEIVRWFNDLDAVQKEQIIKWGLIVAAVGPVLMIFGNLLRSVGLIIESLRIFNPLIQEGHMLFTILHGEGSILHNVLGLLRSGIEALFTPMTAWVAIIAVVIAAIVDLWKNNEEFRENVTRIWNAILDVIQSVWSIVQPILNMLVQIFMEVARAIEPIIAMLVEVLAPIMETIAVLINTIMEFLRPLIDLLTTMLVAALQVVGEVIKVLVNLLKPLVELISMVLQGILGIFNIMFDGFAKILDGIASMWKERWEAIINWTRQLVDRLVNWWNNLPFVKAIKGGFEHIADLFKNGDWNIFSGSHANGLAYVPYDGYIAELHKGERVLTAQENKNYSSGVGGNGTTINFYSNERIDEYTAAKELRRTMKDMELGLV